MPHHSIRHNNVLTTSRIHIQADTNVFQNIIPRFPRANSILWSNACIVFYQIHPRLNILHYCCSRATPLSICCKSSFVFVGHFVIVFVLQTISHDIDSTQGKQLHNHSFRYNNCAINQRFSIVVNFLNQCLVVGRIRRRQKFKQLLALFLVNLHALAKKWHFCVHFFKTNALAQCCLSIKFGRLQ
ncbi:hypothetical protein D3C74_357530 [compost metagenome]